MGELLYNLMHFDSFLRVGVLWGDGVRVLTFLLFTRCGIGESCDSMQTEILLIVTVGF